MGNLRDQLEKMVRDYVERSGDLRLVPDTVRMGEAALRTCVCFAKDDLLDLAAEHTVLGLRVLLSSDPFEVSVFQSEALRTKRAVG